MSKFTLHDAISDEELVKEVTKTKDPEIFGQLYDRYVSRVYNKCYGFSRTPAEAEDLTQDVFLMLYLKIGKFKGYSKFSTWLYSFVYNFCVNHVNRNTQRKMADRTRHLDERDDEILLNVSDQTLLQLSVERLKKAMNIIRPEDKAMLLLKYQDDASIKELMALMNLSESAVKMRLKRAKSRVVQESNKIK